MTHTPTLIADLVAALENVVELYCDLVDSGDCGFWEAEKVDEIIAARAAIQRATSQTREDA